MVVHGVDRGHIVPVNELRSYQESEAICRSVKKTNSASNTMVSLVLLHCGWVSNSRPLISNTYLVECLEAVPVKLLSLVYVQWILK